tara:strand:- start:218 stop:550 length:333 start_codon:yes stop_codon:yes gene_type:complete
MEVKDARNRSKYKYGGIVHKEQKYKDGEHTYKVVYQKPTPTKDKPGDTRLYAGQETTDSKLDAEEFAKLEARKKSNLTPADSLSRADFEKLKNPPKKKPKKRGLFKRRNK